MTKRAYPDHRSAALALLGEIPDLKHKEAGFLGHVCVTGELTPKQCDWLVKLLERHGLPPVAAGGTK